MLPRLIQTTAGLPKHRRWESWKDTVLASVAAAPLDELERFAAERAVAPMAQASFIDTTSGPLTMTRSASEIRRNGVDHACVVVLLEGRGAFEPEGRPAADIQPRDIGFLDLGRPHAVSGLSPYRELRLLVPRDAFAARNGAIELLSGFKVPARDPIGALFTTYLEGYAAALPKLTREQAEAGLDGVLHLLSSLVASAVGVGNDGTAMLSRAGLRTLAERRIAAQLGDPRFNATALARALGVSRTRLYEAFAERGGVAGAIRDARMERASLMLGAADSADHSIETVAALCGFTDYGTFARGFRQRFGASPRDWRGR